ncbi:MAG TPA: hypothetical protein VEJ36_08175 [Nitrososphaerales archaeon]|nr:hypothetical protein [Nitrososphaerales archaeon]
MILPSTTGLLAYLLVIFLPGLGFSELIQPWSVEDGVAARLAIVFGIGLAVDTVVLALKTSGLTIAGVSLVGIGPDTLYSLMVLGAIALSASLVRTRKLGAFVRPTKSDWIVLACVAFILMFSVVYFGKFPIYPDERYADFTNHLAFAEGLVSGNQTSIPSGILYFGVHFQLAAGLILGGGLGVANVQRTAALLASLSPLLVFLASRRVFSRDAPAVFATLVYTFTGTFWYYGVFGVGFYANLFGILATLFFIAALTSLLESASTGGRWLTFLLSVFLLYFSHYTSITILPVALLVPLAKLAVDGGDPRKILTPAIVALLPAALVAIARPRLVHSILVLANNSPGVVPLNSPLSNALAVLPVAQYVDTIFGSDLAFVVFLSLVAVGLYKLYKDRALLALIPVLWALTLVLTAPAGSPSWRFAYELVMPMTMLCGLGLSSLPTTYFGRGKTRRRAAEGRSLPVIPVLVTLVLFAVCPVPSALSGALTGRVDSAQSQSAVYTATLWFGNNTAKNSSGLAVSDWRFALAPSVNGRIINFTFIAEPSAAIQYARQIGASYVIVTDYVPPGFVSAGPPPWQTFPTSSGDGLSLVYSTPDVRIYSIS